MKERIVLSLKRAIVTKETAIAVIQTFVVAIITSLLTKVCTIAVKIRGHCQRKREIAMAFYALAGFS